VKMLHLSHTHTHTHTHTHKSTHKSTHIHTHKSTHTHTCKHTRASTYTHIHTQVAHENEGLRARVATQPVNKSDLNRLVMDRYCRKGGLTRIINIPIYIYRTALLVLRGLLFARCQNN
jgi:hypothetical protein